MEFAKPIRVIQRLDDEAGLKDRTWPRRNNARLITGAASASGTISVLGWAKLVTPPPPRLLPVAIILMQILG